MKKRGPGATSVVFESRQVPSAVTIVADELREAIVEGRIRPGEEIREKRVADQLGVSRGPIRDALRVLADEGLVTLRANRSAIVPELSASMMMETYALRASVGILALRELMSHENNDGREEIQEQFDELLRAVAAHDEPAMVLADMGLQDAIVRASGMAQAAQIFERLTLQVRQMNVALDMHFSDEDSQSIAAEAGELVAAIMDGNEELAEQSWCVKFERWTRELVEHLEGEVFDAAHWMMLTFGVGCARPSGSSARPQRS